MQNGKLVGPHDLLTVGCLCYLDLFASFALLSQHCVGSHTVLVGHLSPTLTLLMFFSDPAVEVALRKRVLEAAANGEVEQFRDAYSEWTQWMANDHTVDPLRIGKSRVALRVTPSQSFAPALSPFDTPVLGWHDGQWRAHMYRRPIDPEEKARLRTVQSAWKGWLHRSERVSNRCSTLQSRE